MTRKLLGSIALLLMITTGIYLFFRHGNDADFATAKETPKVKSAELVPPLPYPFYTGKHVVVNTADMTISLMDGTSTLKEFLILTIGKPDSYYETLGGAYENDYKIKNHFSSIGHVYMPWSVHIFGNFFIHGIPYYPNGAQVSSSYSGGCVRLSDSDAKELYEFVERGTPIIVTQNTAYDFIPTRTSTSTLSSMDMTRLMAGIVSLEVLTQDTSIIGPDGNMTTRRALLPELISGNDEVSHVYAKERGEETFLSYMKEKATSLGLTNTSFASLDSPAETTPEDFDRFITYIKEYKTYLYSIALTQLPAFR